MLILNKHMKGPYTLRGFLELDYPELLEAAESVPTNTSLFTKAMELTTRASSIVHIKKTKSQTTFL